MQQSGERHTVVPGVMVCDTSYFTRRYTMDVGAPPKPEPPPKNPGGALVLLIAIGAFGLSAIAMVAAYVLLVQHMMI